MGPNASSHQFLLPNNLSSMLFQPSLMVLSYMVMPKFVCCAFPPPHLSSTTLSSTLASSPLHRASFLVFLLRLQMYSTYMRTCVHLHSPCLPALRSNLRSNQNPPRSLVVPPRQMALPPSLHRSPPCLHLKLHVRHSFLHSQLLLITMPHFSMHHLLQHQGQVHAY